MISLRLGGYKKRDMIALKTALTAALESLECPRVIVTTCEDCENKKACDDLKWCLAYLEGAIDTKGK